VDYHTLLLTNLSAIIWQQIFFATFTLIKLLSSLKTLFQAYLILAYEPEQQGEEWKVRKWARGGIYRKRLGTTVLSGHFCIHAINPKTLLATRYAAQVDVTCRRLQRSFQLVYSKWVTSSTISRLHACQSDSGRKAVWCANNYKVTVAKQFRIR